MSTGHALTGTGAGSGMAAGAPGVVGLSAARVEHHPVRLGAVESREGDVVVAGAAGFHGRNHVPVVAVGRLVGVP